MKFLIIGWLLINALLLVHWAFTRRARIRLTRTLPIAGASTTPLEPLARVRVKVRYSTQAVAREKIDVYHGKVEII